MKHLKQFILLILIGLLLTGCRGWESGETPVHINPNMDWQPRYMAQTLPLEVPEGTIPFGDNAQLNELSNRPLYIKNNTQLYRGKNANGTWVKKAPIEVDESILIRGQERYDIYCSMCHDKAGAGKGVVIERGFIPPPNLSDARIRAYSDGELYDIISNGIRNMPGYKKQILTEDRWAIVLYVRALQKSRNANISELPYELKNQLD